MLLDDSGQLHQLNKANGAPRAIGSGIAATSGNLGLSPSNVASQLFASSGTHLLRINVVTGATTTIVAIPGLEVNRV
jgi:hypothetical protein